MLASTGNINQPYDVVGVVHASVAKTVSKNGCGVASGLPTQQTYEEATQALKAAAKASGGNAVINIGYDYRVATTTVGCGKNSEPVFEVYAWGTAIRLAAE